MTNQVAITMLKNLEQSLDDYCELNDEGKEAFHMAITALELFGNSEQLPSTHSKLEKNSQKLDNENGELISRQAVIEGVKTLRDVAWKNWHEPTLSANVVLDMIRELPSVQPEQKWETCFDCPLSHGCPKINGCINGQTMEYASDIPNDCPISVQPRKGKWILDNPRSDDSLIYIYACSECHAHHRARYDFCPSCGADMRGDSDEVD